MKWKPIEFEIGNSVKLTTDGKTTILSMENNADKATALDDEALVSLRDACDAAWKLIVHEREKAQSK
jgi:hypothetical protein